MDEQEYRIKAKLNEYHRKALEQKALESKKKFCTDIFRNDLRRAYANRQKTKTANLVSGSISSLAVLGSLKSLAVLPLAFYIGYRAADLPQLLSSEKTPK